MAYRDKYNLQPLKIRIYLRTGIVSDKYLPLDGILLYQAHRLEAGHGPIASIAGDYTSQRISTLPLGMVHSGRKNWYYQCSWAQWSHNIESQDYWNKRFDSKLADMINFKNKRGNIVIKSGKYKAYHMPIFYRVSDWVEWYCIGDKKEIVLFLSTLTHIGKKGSQGWGRIRDVKIDSIDDDYSIWKSGKLMRGIPFEDVTNENSYNIGSYGIRPSYWKSSNQKMLVLP